MHPRLGGSACALAGPGMTARASALIARTTPTLLMPKTLGALHRVLQGRCAPRQNASMSPYSDKPAASRACERSPKLCQLAILPSRNTNRWASVSSIAIPLPVPRPIRRSMATAESPFSISSTISAVCDSHAAKCPRPILEAASGPEMAPVPGPLAGSRPHSRHRRAEGSHRRSLCSKRRRGSRRSRRSPATSPTPRAQRLRGPDPSSRRPDAL